MSDSVNFDGGKSIHPAQAGGIERYTIDDGPARGVRALCVNTGAGLRYRVLVDRGLDIDQAFADHASLTFLSHKGVTPPTRGYDRGLDWLKGFPVGLLTSCGPFNTGCPATDAGAEFCYDAARVDPVDSEPSRQHFRPGVNYKQVPEPLESYRGPDSVVAYLYPKAKDGRATVGVVNRKLGMGLAIRYS